MHVCWVRAAIQPRARTHASEPLGCSSHHLPPSYNSSHPHLGNNTSHRIASSVHTNHHAARTHAATHTHTHITHTCVVVRNRQRCGPLVYSRRSRIRRINNRIDRYMQHTQTHNTRQRNEQTHTHTKTHTHSHTHTHTHTAHTHTAHTPRTRAHIHTKHISTHTYTRTHTSSHNARFCRMPHVC